MKKIENTIKDILINKFNPSILSITNESYMHNVSKGSESHFKVVIVSNSFQNTSKIKQHQSIYKALDDVMNSIHALSIFSFDEAEYKKNPIIIDSPNCANKK